MTRTFIDADDDAYALLAETGVPAADATMYAIDEQARIEHPTVMRALDASGGTVLAEFDCAGWNYLLQVDGPEVLLYRSAESATEHGKSEPFVESLFDTYDVRLVPCANYKYIHAEEDS